MRKELKVGLVALLVLLCVGLVSANALSAPMSKTVQVFFNGITIMVNGRLVQTDAEPLLYQDRTFVPIRAVAEAMGADVSWDAEKNQVVINGRVRLSATEKPTRLCNAWFCAHAFDGLIINESGKAINEAAISCKAFDGDGKEVDHGSWVIQGDGRPGSLPFSLPTSDKPISSNLGTGVSAQCELQQVTFKATN